MQSKCIRISLYFDKRPIIVSPAYNTFEIKKTDVVIPQYFFMLFLSKEKDQKPFPCSNQRFFEEKN